LLFSPPITAILPNDVQLIRFRLRKGADRDQSRNYRVFIEQLVPEGPDRPRGSAFKIRFSMPIFVKPLAVVALPKPSVQVTDLGNGKLQVDASNSGNMHLKITGIALYSGETNPRNVDPKKRLAWSAQPTFANGYLLQNSTRRWIVDAGKQLKDEQYQVVLVTDFYDHYNETDIRADGSYWYPITMK
jgi:P pilus assembly chaperone PapD